VAHHVYGVVSRWITTNTTQTAEAKASSKAPANKPITPTGKNGAAKPQVGAPHSFA